MSKLVLLGLSLFILIASGWASGQFTQWGGDAANSFTTPGETILKKANVASIKQKWLFSLPNDAVYASIVMKDSIVYALTGFAGSLYALNASNGLPVASFNGGQPVSTGIGYYGYDSGSTPALDSQYVYTATDDLVIRSFDRFSGVYNPNWPANGNVKVSVYETVPGGTHQAEIQASMKLFNDVSGQEYFAIVTSSAAEVLEPPQEKGTVTVFNATSGLALWSQVIGGANSDASGMGSWSTPSYDPVSGNFFFGTSNPQAPPAGIYSDALQARRLVSGALSWSDQFVANDVSGQAYPIGVGNSAYMVDRDQGGSPNVLPGGLVGIVGKDAVYRAVDVVTGELAWQQVLTTTPFSLGNPSAAYANGVVYVAASSDIDPNPVVDGFQYPAVDYATQIIGYGGFGGAYVDETANYYLAKILKGCITNQGVLTALNASNGNVLWRKTFPTAFFGTPVVANNLVYVGSYDGTLRVVDAISGVVYFSKVVTPAQDPVPSGSGFNYPLLSNLPIVTNVIVVDGVVYVPFSSIQFAGSGVLALGL